MGKYYFVILYHFWSKYETILRCDYIIISSHQKLQLLYSVTKVQYRTVWHRSSMIFGDYREHSFSGKNTYAQLFWMNFISFYRTRVLSLGMLVSHSLTDSVTFSKLDWCNPGVWRCQLKTCWCCNCCWWGSCWQQFVADFEAEVW